MTKPIETVVSLDPIADVYIEMVEAKRQLDAWKKRYEELRMVVEATIGDAQVATYRGQRVLTYRPVRGKWNTTQIKKDYPDLAGHFTRQVTRIEFDAAAFAQAHPDIASSYQTRTMRELAE